MHYIKFPVVIKKKMKLSVHHVKYSDMQLDDCLNFLCRIFLVYHVYVCILLLNQINKKYYLQKKLMDVTASICKAL